MGAMLPSSLNDHGIRLGPGENISLAAGPLLAARQTADEPDVGALAS